MAHMTTSHQVIVCHKDASRVETFLLNNNVPTFVYTKSGRTGVLSYRVIFEDEGLMTMLKIACPEANIREDDQRWAFTAHMKTVEDYEFFMRCLRIRKHRHIKEEETNDWIIVTTWLTFGESEYIQKFLPKTIEMELTYNE